MNQQKFIEHIEFIPVETRKDQLFKLRLVDKRLDSIVNYDYSDGDSLPTFKWEYRLDEGDNLLTETSFEWDSEINAWREANILNPPNYATPKGIGKYIFSHDEAGMLIFKAAFYWDSDDHRWIGTWKDEYTYDEEGNTVLNINYQYDSETDLWEPLYKDEQQFDGDGTMTSTARYDWNALLGEWIGNWKEEYFYETGNLILKRFSSWDSQEEKWVKDYEEEYIRDESGNIVLFIGYEWNNHKYEYDYDQENNQTSELFSLWNTELNDWEPYSKYEYDYNDDRSLSVKIYFLWLFRSNNWDRIWNEVYNYDEKGNRIRRIKYVRDSEFNKTEFHYDISGNQISEAHYSWISSSNDWREDWMNEFRFDEASNPIMEAYYIYDSILDDLAPDYKKYYYYSTTTGIYQTTNEEILIFPNPTSGTLNITGLTQAANLIIYNLQGKLLKSYYKVQNRVDLTDLDKGVYILILQVEDKGVFRKIFKL